LAEAYFGIDLALQIASNAASWIKIKTHPAVRKDIPLPSSDTRAAKQARIAAFLAVLAHEMSLHIFQPTYLLRDNLNRVLDDLADDDSPHEAHVRSVLLRLGEGYPKEADAATTSHITAAVTNISDYVLELIPEASRPDFKTKLKALCTEASEHWRLIQTLDAKIDLDFDADEAKPLFPNMNLPGSSSSSSSSEPGTTTKPRPNGPPTPSTTTNGKKQPTPTPRRATTLDDDQDDNDIVVWPGFFNSTTTDDDPETLVQGYLLTASQVTAAEAEERAEKKAEKALQPTGFRRAQRQYSRTSRAASVSENGLEKNGVVGVPNGVASSLGTSGSFLSQGSGGGRKGA
jgi:hypothetical protein